MGLLLSLLASVFVNFHLSRKQQIFVGIDASGRPEVLIESSMQRINVETYCREVIGLLFSYSPNTVEQNFKQVIRYLTPKFIQAYKGKIGSEFVDSVTKNNIVQMSNIVSITIKNLSESGFSSEILTSRLRSDEVIRRTTEDMVLITLTMVRGTISVENPWGLYVDMVVENLRSVNTGGGK